MHCTIAVVRCPLLTRCGVPASLEEVTAVGATGRLYYLWDVVRQIGLACGKVQARPRPAAVAPAAQRSVS